MKHCLDCDTSKDKSEFYTSARAKDGLQVRCKKCSSDRGKKYWAIHKERLLTRHRVWNGENVERRREQARRWAKKNRKKLVAAVLRYQKKHPAKVNAITAAYEASKIRALPAWANKFFIEEIYDLSQRRTKLKTGGVDEWHVDHIVPLRSPLVCGLHNEFNLQVIPGKENVSKGNRIWPDMP